LAELIDQGTRTKCVWRRAIECAKEIADPSLVFGKQHASVTREPAGQLKLVVINRFPESRETWDYDGLPPRAERKEDRAYAAMRDHDACP